MCHPRRVALPLLILGPLLAAPPAQAAAERVYVSAQGADSNPCSLAAPCRTFAAAVGAVASGGEVIALDSAGYGTVTITQSLSITAPPGVYAGIAVPPGGDGVLINGTNATVTLRGLVIGPAAASGVGFTGSGVNVRAAAALTVDRCVISGMPYAGIETLAAPSTQATGLTLSVENTQFEDDGYGAALFLVPAQYATGATVTANIYNVTMNGGGNFATSGNTALYIANGVTATIDASHIVGYWAGVWVTSVGTNASAAPGTVQVTATNNVINAGFWGVIGGSATGSTASVTLRGNVVGGTASANYAAIQGVTANQSGGVFAYPGAGLTVSLDANTITGNTVGINSGGSGAIVKTYVNNRLSGNGTPVVGPLTSATLQ